MSRSTRRENVGPVSQWDTVENFQKVVTVSRCTKMWEKVVTVDRSACPLGERGNLLAGICGRVSPRLTWKPFGARTKLGDRGNLSKGCHVGSRRKRLVRSPDRAIFGRPGKPFGCCFGRFPRGPTWKPFGGGAKTGDRGNLFEMLCRGTGVLRVLRVVPASCLTLPTKASQATLAPGRTRCP